MNIVRQEPNACAALYYEFFGNLWRPVTGRSFVFAIYFLTLKANDAGPGQMVVRWRFGPFRNRLHVKRKTVIIVLGDQIEGATVSRFRGGEIVPREKIPLVG